MINIIQSTINIFTIYYNLGAKYLAAADESMKAKLQTQINCIQAVSDGMVFLILFTLIAGTLLYGLASLRGSLVDKSLGYCFLLNWITAALWAIAFYAGWNWLRVPMTWSTRILWILLFFVLSVWLWTRRAEQEA